MKIKEIADTYGIKYVEFPPDIINSICFNKENACAIMEKAAKEVVLQSQAQLKDFAEKENVVLNEDRITDAVNKFMHYINESIRDSIDEI